VLDTENVETDLVARARVTGRLADPQVSVNPASAVTPGFVRGFFDLFTGSSGADSEPRPRQE